MHIFINHCLSPPHQLITSQQKHTHTDTHTKILIIIKNNKTNRRNKPNLSNLQNKIWSHNTVISRRKHTTHHPFSENLDAKWSISKNTENNHCSPTKRRISFHAVKMSPVIKNESSTLQQLLDVCGCTKDFTEAQLRAKHLPVLQKRPKKTTRSHFQNVTNRRLHWQRRLNRAEKNIFH